MNRNLLFTIAVICTLLAAIGTFTFSATSNAYVLTGSLCLLIAGAFSAAASISLKPVASSIIHRAGSEEKEK